MKGLIPRSLRALWGRVRGPRPSESAEDERLLRWGPALAPRSLTSVQAICEALRPLDGPPPEAPSLAWCVIMEGRQAARWREVITATAHPHLLPDLVRLFVEEAVVTGPKLWTMLIELGPQTDQYIQDRPAWDTPAIHAARDRWRHQVVGNWVAPRTEGSPAAQIGYQDHAALQQVAEDAQTPTALITRLIQGAVDERVPPLPVQSLIQLARRPNLGLNHRAGLIQAMGREPQGSAMARVYGLHALLHLESWSTWCQEPVLVARVLALTQETPQLWWCLLDHAPDWPEPLWAAWSAQTDRIATDYPEVASLRLRGLAPEHWGILPAGVVRWAFLHTDRTLRIAALQAAGHIEAARRDLAEARRSPGDAVGVTESPSLVAQHQRAEEPAAQRKTCPSYGGPV